MIKETSSDLTFEEALKSLEIIVDKLESGDVALEEAISLYSKGEELKSFCEKKLRQAEEKISKITLNDQGTFSAEQVKDNI
tara:strand:+ start:15 stop:257 length:243 start_codon:yes stop_codon:yes gene_type:complete